MKVIISFILFYFFSITVAWTLPICKGSPGKDIYPKHWDNCTGVYYFKDKFGNEIKFKGEFKNGLGNGKGSLSFKEGVIYEGEYKDSHYHGYGIHNYLYAQTIEKQNMHLKRYEGDFKNSKRHGKGTLYFKDGSSYVGGWHDDTYDGDGIMTFSDGRVWVGIFKNGEWIDGKKYSAIEYKNIEKENVNYNRQSEYDISTAKSECKEIGFKEETEKFADCVLELYKTKKNKVSNKNNYDEQDNVNEARQRENMSCQTKKGTKIVPIIDTSQIRASCIQAVNICWTKGEQAYWAAKNGDTRKLDGIVQDMKQNNPYGLLPDLTGLFGAIAGDNKAQKIGANVLSGCLASYGYGAS